MSTMKMEVRGLQELIAKTRDKKLIGEPLRRFFNRATLKVESRGKVNAPVDKGRLRGGLASEVDTAEIPRWGKVGTDVSHRGFPYPKALDESDRYHYRGGGALGLSGANTQGWFSERSVQASLEDIRGYLREAGSDIKAIWDS